MVGLFEQSSNSFLSGSSSEASYKTKHILKSKKKKLFPSNKENEVSTNSKWINLSNSDLLLMNC